jgi:hypothetical protein
MKNIFSKKMKNVGDVLEIQDGVPNEDVSAGCNKTKI